MTEKERKQIQADIKDCDEQLKKPIPRKWKEDIKRKKVKLENKIRLDKMDIFMKP